MMPFSQSHCGVFNDICCRSLKTGKRFSIANNYKKKKIKRTRNKNRYEIKTGTKKKKRDAKPDRTEKKQIFITVRNTKISGVFKRTNFYSNR